MKFLVGALLFFSSLPAFSSDLRPFLFALERNGQTSFVLGSLHSGVPAKDLPPYVFRAMKASRIFATEISYSALSPEILRPSIATDIEMPKPEIRKILRQRGIPDYLHNSSFICTFFQIWEFSGSRMDYELFVRATKIKMKFETLELAEDVKIMNDELDQNLNKCNITELVKSDWQAMRDFNLSLIQGYRKGDFNFTPPLRGFDAERTKKWIPKIETLHQSGVFIVIGAAHLHGSEGLLQLLTTRGFRVTRINSNHVLRSLGK